MSKAKKQSQKVRLHFDVTPEINLLIQNLQQTLDFKSQSDIFIEAFNLFAWVTEEIKSGQRVISLQADELGSCNRYKELVSPTFRFQIKTTYKYLVARPHPWRKQLYIKGRNMTVGQLIYSIRTNNLSEEDAANDFDLPLPAIKEALQYYALNKELIELEALEEKRSLQEKGYKLEPQNLSR